LVEGEAEDVENGEVGKLVFAMEQRSDEERREGHNCADA